MFKWTRTKGAGKWFFLHAHKQTLVPISHRRSIGSTHLKMPCPCLVGRRHCARLGVVIELGVLAQAAPETVLLASVVGLVDEVALVGVSAVFVDKSLHGAFPCLRFEGATIAQAEGDGLAEGAEESGLELRTPGESWPAVLAGGRRPASARAGGREVLVGHVGGRVEPSKMCGGDDGDYVVVVAMELRLGVGPKHEGARNGGDPSANSSGQPRHTTIRRGKSRPNAPVAIKVALAQQEVINKTNMRNISSPDTSYSCPVVFRRSERNAVL